MQWWIMLIGWNLTFVVWGIGVSLGTSSMLGWSRSPLTVSCPSSSAVSKGRAGLLVQTGICITSSCVPSSVSRMTLLMMMPSAVSTSSSQIARGLFVLLLFFGGLDIIWVFIGYRWRQYVKGNQCTLNARYKNTMGIKWRNCAHHKAEHVVHSPCGRYDVNGYPWGQYFAVTLQIWSDLIWSTQIRSDSELDSNFCSESEQIWADLIRYDQSLLRN